MTRCSRENSQSELRSGESGHTRNIAQARRANEECIFMLSGRVIEHAPTGDMFVTPRKHETADYIKGRYG